MEKQKKGLQDKSLIQEGNHFRIAQEALDAITNYIVQRPYAEVAHLIQGLQKNTEFVPKGDIVSEKDDKHAEEEDKLTP